MAVIIGTIIAAILVWAVGIGIWFGISTLLVWVLSLIGVIEFNILYAVALTIIIVIIQGIFRAARSSTKKDD